MHVVSFTEITVNVYCRECFQSNKENKNITPVQFKKESITVIFKAFVDVFILIFKDKVGHYGASTQRNHYVPQTVKIFS